MAREIKAQINSFHTAFEKLVTYSKSVKDPNERLHILKVAANVATYRYMGYLASYSLEAACLELSEMLNIVPEGGFMPKSILHVATKVGGNGGHTRAIYNFVNNLEAYRHDLVLTEQNKPIPEWLEESILKQGGTIDTIRDLPMKSAERLFEKAQQYELVILHIHMYDVVPVVAFGSEHFARPVIFFNHADHVFSVGMSVSDLVDDIRTSKQPYSLRHRGAARSFHLPIPLELKEAKKRDREETRRKLRIAPDETLILSIGADFKYRPFGPYDFIKTLEKIRERSSKKVRCIVVGPSKSEAMWKAAYQTSQGRIDAKGFIPKEELDDYIAAADLYIESFPFGSATALVEVLQYNIPTISLNAVVEGFDSIQESAAIATTPEEVVTLACKFLDGELVVNTEVMDNIRKWHLNPAWREKFQEMLTHLPPNHQVHAFQPERTSESFNEYTYKLTKQSYSDTITVNFYDIKMLGTIRQFNVLVRLISFAIPYRYLLALMVRGIKYRLRYFLRTQKRK